MKIKVTTSIHRLGSLPGSLMLVAMTIAASTTALAHGEQSAVAMAETANRLIASYDVDQRQKAA